MKFCPWYPLNESAAIVPPVSNIKRTLGSADLDRPCERLAAGQGIWQVRQASGLLSYPRGKSAMVHYHLSRHNVAVDIAAFAQAHPMQSPSWLCRHLISDDDQALPPDTALDEFYDTLLAQFVARFGQMPQVPPL
jgi:hypothetical protein